MLARKVRGLKLLTCRESGGSFTWMPKPSTFSSDTGDVDKTPLNKLKPWRRPWDQGNLGLTSRLKVFDRDTGRPTTDIIVKLNQPWDLRISTIRKWFARKRLELEILDQKFLKKRHEILGSNLGAAHFLVCRGAKVKFLGKPKWVEKDEEDNYELPSKFEPNWLIEAIDINGMNLYYQGLENMYYLSELRWLSFKGSKTIDDWCLDRISSRYPGLEYLDISDCEKVSERGLEALYRMHSLRNLVVTNHHRTPAFELTCMMLEDCIPGLECNIKLPKGEDESAPNKVEAEVAPPGKSDT